MHGNSSPYSSFMTRVSVRWDLISVVHGTGVAAGEDVRPGSDREAVRGRQQRGDNQAAACVPLEGAPVRPGAGARPGQAPQVLHLRGGALQHLTLPVLLTNTAPHGLASPHYCHTLMPCRSSEHETT